MLLFKAMATVTGMTLISRISGFARDILTAAFLGAGAAADAFFVALKLPNFFRRITAEGAFSVAFVPMFSKKLDREGQAEAGVFASDTLAFMTVILLPLTCVAVVAMPWIMAVIAPGFDAADPRFDHAVAMTRITFPYLLLMSIAALLGGMLNSAHKFYPFAVAPVLFNLCLIAALLMAGSESETAGFAMAWGVTISGIVQILWLGWHIRRSGLRLPVFRVPRFSVDVKKLFVLMGPGIVGAGVLQINVFIDLIIASTLETGSISHLYYADRLNQLPLGTVGIAVGTALLPLLSQALVRGDHADAARLFNRALELTCVLAIPAALALYILAGPIMQVLFERGEFTAHDSHVTAIVLMGYAVGLPAYIIGKVYASVYWSNHDTMTPVKIGIGIAVLNTILALALSRVMGVAGISLATGLVGWIQVILFVHGTRHNPVTDFDDRLRRVMPRILGACLAMTLVLYGLYPVVQPFLDQGGFMRLMAFGALVAAGGGLYAILIVTLNVLTLSDLRGFFRKDVRPSL